MENKEVQLFKVGHLVKLKQRLGFEPAGIYCLVYENYDMPGRTGISVITINGVNLGGFSLSEQLRMFSFVRDSGVKYNFTNSAQLRMDWKAGYLKEAFLTPKHLQK
jgi:hypothetical protein